MPNQNGNYGINGHQRNSHVNLSGNGHNPADSIPGHDFLWDSLAPAVAERLAQPLDPALASQRKGRGNRRFDYIEGHTVIGQANEIFGFGGWGYELAGDVSLRRMESLDTKTGEMRVSYAYSAPVRVTVSGAPSRTDIGFHVVAEDTPEDRVGFPPSQQSSSCRTKIGFSHRRSLRCLLWPSYLPFSLRTPCVQVDACSSF